MEFVPKGLGLNLLRYMRDARECGVRNEGVPKRLVLLLFRYKKQVFK